MAALASHPAPPADPPSTYVSKWSSRYRGATVEDLDPPAALSFTPNDPISAALLSAFERDYTHLTVVDAQRALVGYLAIPHLQALLDAEKVTPTDPLSKAMVRFQRKGRTYRVITMQTPLEELEAFFEGDGVEGRKSHFAVITDEKRRFVLGVATVQDLEEFVNRRPA
ncbi:Cystathionine beta-synthase [Colletotrichum sidae]|uniref:Cystathionine beta-synthase n=1 Tax=Colletotrichum sidae TaxID=1347389 RepID=A0A4V3I422_9PEZI|nr:Cystathionine beta-synthase [Colletotrichum sidae]